MKKLLDHTFYDFPPGADLSGSPEQPENTGNIPMSGLPEYIDPRTGDVHEQIPLRDFIRDHPVMQALDPVLKMRPVPEKSGDFKAFRTMLEKHAVKSKNPDRNDRKRMTDIEQAYATYLDRTRIFISEENEFPGTRRIVLLGSAFISMSPLHSIAFMAIMNDGRLFNGILKPVIQDTAPLSSIAEALEIIMVGRKHWNIERWNQVNPFNLDQCSNEFKNLSAAGLTRIEKLVSQREYDRIMPGIRANTVGNLDLARQALCTSLDSDILHCMRDTGQTNVEFGCWLTNGDGAPGNVALARQQAVNAYPMMARDFYLSPVLRNAIDTRTSLSDAIAKRWNVPAVRVKRLSGLTWQKIAAKPNDTKLMVHEILGLPEGSVPNDRVGFQDLEILRNFGFSLYQKNLIETMKHLSKGGNPWCLLDRIKQTSGHDVRDAVNFLVLKLYIPAGLEYIRRITADLNEKTPRSAKHRKIFSDFKTASSVGDESFLDLKMKTEKLSHEKMKKTGQSTILSTFTPRELLDFSDWYHRNLARCEDCLETISLNIKWNGMFDSIDLGNGYIARELTSSRELKIQGRHENHCVGGYVSRVLGSTFEMNGRMTLIFSIEQENQIYCTTEILCEQIKKGTRLHAWVGQCQDKHNKIPPRAARDMAGRIASILSQTKPAICQTYLDELRRVKLEYNQVSKFGPRIMECGFDPWDSNMLERAWEILSPALPRRLRKPGLDNFLTHIPFDSYTLITTLAERAALSENKTNPVESTKMYVSGAFNDNISSGE